MGSLKSLTFRAFTVGKEAVELVDLLAASLEVLDLGISEWPDRRLAAVEPRLAFAHAFPRLPALTLRGTSFVASSILTSLVGSPLTQLHLGLGHINLVSDLAFARYSATIHSYDPLPAVDLFSTTLRYLTIEDSTEGERLDAWDCDELKRFCHERGIATSVHPSDAFYTTLSDDVVGIQHLHVSEEVEALLEFRRGQVERAMLWEESDRLVELRTALLELRKLRMIWED